LITDHRSATVEVIDGVIRHFVTGHDRGFPG
jgi:hypothetical protein